MDKTHPPALSTDPPRTTRSPVTSISKLVIQTIATAEECDPSLVTPPLYDAIDPDALDSIYARASPHMQFDYADYEIEITPERTVTIRSA